MRVFCHVRWSDSVLNHPMCGTWTPSIKNWTTLSQRDLIITIETKFAQLKIERIKEQLSLLYLLSSLSALLVALM